MEDKGKLFEGINKTSNYITLDNMCISLQYGFSSMKEDEKKHF